MAVLINPADGFFATFVFPAGAADFFILVDDATEVAVDLFSFFFILGLFVFVWQMTFVIFEIERLPDLQLSAILFEPFN